MFFSHCSHSCGHLYKLFSSQMQIHIQPKVSPCPSFMVSPFRMLRLSSQDQKLQFVATWRSESPRLSSSFWAAKLIYVYTLELHGAAYEEIKAGVHRLYNVHVKLGALSPQKCTNCAVTLRIHRCVVIMMLFHYFH